MQSQIHVHQHLSGLLIFLSEKEDYVRMVIQNDETAVYEDQKHKPYQLLFVVLLLFEVKQGILRFTHMGDKVTVHKPFKRLHVIQQSIQHFLHEEEYFKREWAYVKSISSSSSPFLKIWEVVDRIIVV